MNVIDTIDKNFCIGCGVCVSVCPSGHLKLKRNDLNQLEIQETENTSCNNNCRICLSICPFSDHAANEDELSRNIFKSDELKYQKECGYYIGSYIGYHPDDSIRMNSASGGLTTYLLDYLINNQYIEAAVTVKRNLGKPYFSYTICKNSKELLSCCGSAYCALQIGDILKQIINDNSIKSIAIVALPCFCKSIRNACKFNIKLKNKIKYVIGLVCGQQKSLSFAEYLSEKHCISNLKEIHFRTKKQNRPNGNFGIRLIGSDNHTKEITFSSYSKEWAFKLFTVSACNYCDDIFAETADIVFMDAWLPEYKDSDKGENIVITRNIELDKIIRQIDTVKSIPISKAIYSQSAVIYNKRHSLSVHLKLAQRSGLRPPQKRKSLLHDPNIFEIPLIKSKYFLSNLSEQLWKDSYHDYSIFTTKLKKWRLKIVISLFLNKLGIIIKKIAL